MGLFFSFLKRGENGEEDTLKTDREKDLHIHTEKPTNKVIKTLGVIRVLPYTQLEQHGYYAIKTTRMLIWGR